MRGMSCCYFKTDFELEYWTTTIHVSVEHDAGGPNLVRLVNP